MRKSCYLVTGQITKPITELTLIAKKLESGDFSTKAKARGKDEIGVLAGAFNIMTEKLEESYRGLEQKVLARTKDLREAKAKDEAMLASIGDGFVATDKDGKIVLTNKAFQTHLGWSEKEVQGKKLSDVVPMLDGAGKAIAETDRPIMKALRQKSTTTTTTTTTLQYKRKDGSHFPVYITVAPVVLEGKLLGAVEVFRDITIEKDIDSMKTEFISIASHQLRTPLTAIKLFVEMLLKGRAGGLEKKQKEYLEDVSFSTERMITLVNDLLNVSRLETGRLKIEPVQIDLAQYVKGIVEAAQPLCKPKKCQLAFENQGSIKDKVGIDDTLASQVFHNLITNAIRYSKEGGKILVSLNKKANEGYIVSVHDNGIGIPEASQKRIFEKFYRADNAQKAEATGSGLGMYLAKMILEASGGKIWFESKENEGTMFYVSIPKEGMKEKKGEKSLA